MKKFDRVFLLTVICYLAIVVVVNILINKYDSSLGGKEYRVAINRIEKAIDNYEENLGKAPQSIQELYKNTDIPDFDCILEIDSVSVDADKSELKLLLRDDMDYSIFVTDNAYYKIVYDSSYSRDNRIYIYMNIVFILVLCIIIGVYIYLRVSILKPFNELSDLPYELSKGTLNKPLEERKNKYFGKYIWGMNMLREILEDSKKKELELQKEKKMLLLSLSHDIKTPLNAISLYSKAINKNLYKDEERRKEVTANIDVKVNEIEGYVSEIVKASNEDFLVFEVNNSEVYIKDVLFFVEDYYMDKMQLNQIDFAVEPYINSLVSGDKERIIEVVQNVVENAIKYGDGRKIHISTNKDEEEYDIIIKNTGCTLTNNELCHVFDSFFRGTNVGKKNGSGLGLYICRELMHLMNGEILANIVNDENERIMEVKISLRLA